jgi:hypothetical protein
MAHPTTWLEASQCARESQKVVNSQIKKPSFISQSFPTNPSLPSPPLNIHKLTHDKMLECQLKGIFYNYDEKYFPRNNCKE